MGDMKLLSPRKVALVLDLKPRTIERRCREGHYPSAHKVGRLWRIDYDDPVLHEEVHGTVAYRGSV